MAQPHSREATHHTNAPQWSTNEAPEKPQTTVNRQVNSIHIVGFKNGSRQGGAWKPHVDSKRSTRQLTQSTNNDMSLSNWFDSMLTGSSGWVKTKHVSPHGPTNDWHISMIEDVAVPCHATWTTRGPWDYATCLPCGARCHLNNADVSVYHHRLHVHSRLTARVVYVPPSWTFLNLKFLPNFS